MDRLAESAAAIDDSRDPLDLARELVAGPPGPARA